MAQAYLNEEFEAIFRAPGETGATITLTQQLVGDTAYIDLPDITAIKFADGEYKVDETFTRLGIHLLRFGSSTNTVEVIYDILDAIQLRVDNQPMG